MTLNEDAYFNVQTSIKSQHSSLYIRHVTIPILINIISLCLAHIKENNSDPTLHLCGWFTLRLSRRRAPKSKIVVKFGLCIWVKGGCMVSSSFIYVTIRMRLSHNLLDLVDQRYNHHRLLIFSVHKEESICCFLSDLTTPTKMQMRYQQPNRKKASSRLLPDEFPLNTLKESKARMEWGQWDVYETGLEIHSAS